jgi:hypothetical protein
MPYYSLPGAVFTAHSLQNIESQHPPHQKDRNDCSCNVDDPVATRFWIPEIEHDEIVACGTKQWALCKLLAGFCLSRPVEAVIVCKTGLIWAF